MALYLQTFRVWIQNTLSKDDFYFYDAIAPVVDADSLDYSKLYFKDRHKQADESADYLNAPMNEQQYYEFVEELVQAQKVPPASLSISLKAVFLLISWRRGKDTARFSCMKPIGLGIEGKEAPLQLFQLRKENLLGSALTLLAFKTKAYFQRASQSFRKIPGFENASFIHLGSVHRNSFLNSKTSWAG